MAENVLGHKVVHTHFNRGKSHTYTIGEPDYYDDQGEMKLFNPLPRYSTDIKAAWEIMEKVSSIGSVFKAETPLWGCNVEEDTSIRGKSAAEAICVAALRAIGPKNV